MPNIITGICCKQCGGPISPQRVTIGTCAFCGAGIQVEGTTLQFSIVAWEKGLPSDLLILLREALMNLSEFDSNSALRTFFAQHQELSLFQSGLPEGDSPKDRVNYFIAYSIGRKYATNLYDWRAGLTLLQVFLAIIIAHQRKLPAKTTGMEELINHLKDAKAIPNIH